jgi:Uma2 family endonuclease
MAPEPMPAAAARTDSAPLGPLPPELWPNIDHLVTEDGKPVDGIYSEKQMRLLTEPLYSSWRPGHPFAVMANVGLFYGLHDPPIVPDVLLSRDVQIPHDLFQKKHRSYFVWEYGKPPEVVIEVVSNKEGGEQTEKPAIYAKVGVPYYIIWDPLEIIGQQKLHVLRLRERTYEEMTGAWLPLLGLGLKPWQGRFEDEDWEWLRWVDRDGKLIPTGVELADEAKRRADEETRRADEETRRAAEAMDRADRLAAQLRALGAVPEEK